MVLESNKIIYPKNFVLLSNNFGGKNMLFFNGFNWFSVGNTNNYNYTSKDFEDQHYKMMERIKKRLLRKKKLSLFISNTQGHKNMYYSSSGSGKELLSMFVGFKKTIKIYCLQKLTSKELDAIKNFLEPYLKKKTFPKWEDFFKLYHQIGYHITTNVKKNFITVSLFKTSFEERDNPFGYGKRYDELFNFNEQGF